MQKASVLMNKWRFLVIVAVALLVLGPYAARNASSATSKKGTVQLLMWHMEQPPNRVQQFQKVLDAFNKSQKSVFVKQEVQNWADIYQKAPSAISSGNGPDMLFAIPDFTTYVKQTGAVQPVDDVVKQLDRQHHFLASAIRPYQYGGHIWAVPLYGMIQVLWYRKDMFKAAGLNPNRPPRTWSELYADAKKLTGHGKYGIGIACNKHLYTDQEFYTFMITNKGKDLFTSSGKLNFDTKNNIETLKFYTSLYKFSPAGSCSWTWAEPQADLNNGTLAMAIEKGQFLGPFEQQAHKPASDLGAAAVPVAPGGQQGGIYYPNAVMLLTKDSAKRKAFAQFLSFLLKPKYYAEFLLAEPGLFLPETKDGNSSYWRNSPVLRKYPQAVKLMLDLSKHGYLFGFTSNKVNQGIGKISAQNFLAQVVQKAIIQHMSPQAAVAWGQQTMAAAAGQK